jgi:quercetin dioxygenase-like cupin family protein
MAKSTVTYWNPLKLDNHSKWQPITGMEDMAEELTLSIDEVNGDYTRLTRFKPGADTSAFGAKSHTYPEEIMILEGSLYDAAFDQWLETGDYASRPPGEVHGPFRTEDGCVVLEMSYPSKSVEHL